jgi:hypothetical protein
MKQALEDLILGAEIAEAALERIYYTIFMSQSSSALSRRLPG